MTETLYKGNLGIKKPCCMECEPEVIAKKQRDVERVRKWRERQPDIKDRRNAEARKRLMMHGDKVRGYRKDYYQRNNEDLREYRRNYIKENPWFNRAASAKKRAIIKQRTVPWADMGRIKEFYRNCPEGMVVDHIVPLKGKNVSGLHVHTNLQYLTPKENGVKSNRYEV